MACRFSSGRRGWLTVWIFFWGRQISLTKYNMTTCDLCQNIQCINFIPMCFSLAYYRMSCMPNTNWGITPYICRRNIIIIFITLAAYFRQSTLWIAADLVFFLSSWLIRDRDSTELETSWEELETRRYPSGLKFHSKHFQGFIWFLLDVPGKN